MVNSNIPIFSSRWRQIPNSKKVDSNDLLHPSLQSRSPDFQSRSSIAVLVRSRNGLKATEFAKENVHPVLVVAGVQTYDFPHPRSKY